MNNFFVGFVTGVAIVGLFLLVPKVFRIQREIGLGLFVQETSIGETGSMLEFSDQDGVIFQVNPFSNGFTLTVPADQMPFGSLRFHEVRDGNEKFQYLSTCRIDKKGTMRTLKYDMTTGEVEAVILANTETGETEMIIREGYGAESNADE